MGRTAQVTYKINPDQINATITVATATSGHHLVLIDGFRLPDLSLTALRVYPGLYLGRLCLFCSPRGTPKPRPLHLYLHGTGLTFRNGNSFDCRLINMAKAGELHSNVILAPNNMHRAYADIRGDYIHLGDFPTAAEAHTAVTDASDLCREVLTDLLSPNKATL